MCRERDWTVTRAYFTDHEIWLRAQMMSSQTIEIICPVGLEPNSLIVVSIDANIRHSYCFCVDYRPDVHLLYVGSVCVYRSCFKPCQVLGVAPDPLPNYHLHWIMARAHWGIHSGGM